MDKQEKMQCAKCTQLVCTGGKGEPPSFCPMRTKADVIKKAKAEYNDKEICSFAHTAILNNNESWIKDPHDSRPQEVINFAKRMGYKKIGIASCIGLSREAGIMATAIENQGLEAYVHFCKVGIVHKVDDLGLKKEEALVLGAYDPMCHPILQALLLDDAECDMNIAIGQCVGHDSLFLKYSKFPCVSMLCKDRLLGQNPIAALHLAHGPFYKRLLTKEGAYPRGSIFDEKEK